MSLYMPFEGHEHTATIMMLPYRIDTWADKGKKASTTFFDIILAIANHEIVYVLKDHRVLYDISPILNNPQIVILDIDYNDCWARDTAPIFVIKNDTLMGVDFRFNAWGGKVDGLYDDYELDDQVAKKICQTLNLKHHYVKDFILEGGSIHTDGNGLFLTTEACLLSKGRNPMLSKQDIEKYLITELGAKEIIWLPRGIYEDETNEHIDNIACFIKPGVVALAWTDDTNDPQYPLSLLAYEELLKHKQLEIVKVKHPTPMYLSAAEADALIPEQDSKKRLAGSRLAGSYINFYQGKDYVILPQFGVNEDKIALRQFKNLFPDKKIYHINSKEILLSGGNIHCLTMQIPKFKPLGEPQ